MTEASQENQHEATVAQTFDDWASGGKAEGMEDGHGNVVAQLMDKMGIEAGERILDLGCGNGWATRALAKANAGVQAIGVDVSPGMIARADELHSYTIRARYDLGRFEALDFEDGEFDRIFSMEALYYTEDLDAALIEMHRVLKPGGVVDVIVDCFAENPGSATWSDAMGMHLHRLPEAEWATRFGTAGFASAETARLIDNRGPGDVASFEPGTCFPNWDAKKSAWEAGSLWIHALKGEG